MTWTKLGTEFFDDCAEAVLSDAAVRTHAEAIGYLYGQENFDLTLKKSTMRRWAGSDCPEEAALELVAAGMWTDGKAEWTVVHHADVIRQSLTAQLKKREDDKARARKKRGYVGSDVGSDVHATQTDRQTYKQTASNEGSSSGWNFAPAERVDLNTGEVLSFTECRRCSGALVGHVQQTAGLCGVHWMAEQEMSA
ncbi:MAG TPA: hypothetical protein VK390_11930 [Propionibacteriaceae bacterium]|nr:hypothetical protein [Propionibacteriaceae bacterium]